MKGFTQNFKKMYIAIYSNMKAHIKILLLVCC